DNVSARETGSIGVKVNGTPTRGGGMQPADRNVIAQHSAGVTIGNGATGTVVLGNLFGSDKTAAEAHPNVFSVSDNSNLLVVPMGDAAAPTRFVASSGPAINLVAGNTNGVEAFANRFGFASNMAINLGPGGVTTNDADDADTGANGLQNFPTLSLA